MKRAASIAYLLAVHAVLAYLLWSRLAPHPPQYVADRGVVLQWRDATTPPGAAVFLGDSITERLAVTAVASGAVNFGVSRQTSTEMLEAIPHSVQTASRVYLLIGVNDIARGERVALESNLSAILAAIPGPLIWTGVMLPEAAPVNAKIKSLCEARPHCVYVPPLTDPALFVDGVHLNAAGYRAWIARLKSPTPQSRRPVPQ